MNIAFSIALSTAWTPLYDAYQIIAETYQIHFVLKVSNLVVESIIIPILRVIFSQMNIV